MVSEPYMTMNEEYYIQLWIQELSMCKHINYEYLYEELTLVRNKSKHNSESALFFYISKQITESNCEFHYDYNTT